MFNVDDNNEKIMDNITIQSIFEYHFSLYVLGSKNECVSYSMVKRLIAFPLRNRQRSVHSPLINTCTSPR